MTQTLERTLTSLEIAEMVGREHRSVIRDIRNIIEHLGGEHKIVQSYFIESSYANSQNKELPCYLLTKKGCELYGTRMTGAKGTQFAVKYIERFNQMENELSQKKIPGSYKEALLALVEQLEQNEQLETENRIFQQQIAEAQPKLTYVDMVLKCSDLLTITQIADDYGMSAISFNKLLNEQGIQYKQSGQWLLYSQFKGQGYTKSETITYRRTDDSQGVRILTKWTQKGRLFLYELLKAQGILPTIEKNAA